jgi:predicted DNA-binding transcriptional regulator YafY
MDNRKIFMRTSLILQRLQKSPATLKEINTYLERNSNHYGEEFSVSQRTIGRDLDKIRSMHQIDIVYDYSRKLYLIDNEGQPEVNKRMMESIDILNAMQLADGMNNLILFENRQSSGTENLYGLLHAIKNRYQISFTYQKFFETQKTHRVAEPYGLREFRGHWYLVVKDIKKGEEEYIKNFGLDRISNLEISKKQFDVPNNFNLSDHFRYSFGSIVPYDGEPQEIILAFSPYQGNYIKSTPLHHSQRILTDNSQELQVSLHVYVTDELIAQLLSYGNKVKILQPEELAERVREEHLAAV